MIFRKSIRWRIQAWHGLLLVAMTTAFCVTTWRLERANAYGRFDDELKRNLGVLMASLQQKGPRGGPDGDPGEEPMDERPPPPGPGKGPPQGRGKGPPPGLNSPEVRMIFGDNDPAAMFYQIWGRGSDRVANSSNVPVSIPLPGTKAMDPRLRIRGDFREYYLFTPPGDCLLVGRSCEPVDRALRDFAWKIAGIGGALLVVGLTVGWWISSRALKPISAISAAATRISEGHLKERIHTPETESELGRLALVLDDAFRRVDAAFDEQARFTSDAAHELRTPVSIILAQSQLALSRERDAAFYRDTIETTQRAAKRMQGLIESLLELAVLDAAAGSADLQAGDLATLCGELLPSLRVLTMEKGSVLTSDFQPAACRINPEQIGQVVTNLVENAVKYCESGSEVHVSTGIRDGRAFLSVRDNGPGIEPEHLEHLFERFYRTDRSRSSSTGGTGLGLAICKRIADAHDGSLSVESRIGKGSIFILEMRSFTLGS